MQRGINMGLFDSLLKRTTRSVTNSVSNRVSNAVGNAVSNAVGGALEKALGNVTGQKPAQAQQTAAPAQQSGSQAAQNTCTAASTEPAANKLRRILASEFSSYEVKENVSPTTIGGTGKFMNYSFGVYSGGQPKLFIMLIGKTTCSTRTYRWSKEQAQRNGITMINFIEHYPNEEEYVINRLHRYL